MARPGGTAVFSREILVRAIGDSFGKLDPRTLVRNPVMFIVEVGSVITTFIFFRDLIRGHGEALWFTGTISFWLWLTVLFANLAEAIAEGRGKAQADALRATRTTTVAHRRIGGSLEDVAAPELMRGDIVVVSAGEIIPADGDVIEGVGSVDESAITGESAPVIREAGGDRSAVTGGTKLLSDQLVIKVTQEPGQSFLDRMIALVEGTERRKTPNEIALNILLAGLTITFLGAVVTLKPFADFADTPVSTTVLIALLVALIPTTIGALLSAIGIAGMDRLVQRNVLAMSGRAVEASGDVDVLLLDKTGTITLGNRQAAEFIPVDGVEERELAEVAQLASLADETPEGRSIVVLAKERYGLRERQLSEIEATFVPFTATTRMSGVDMDGHQIRKGAADAVKRFLEANGGRAPAELDAAVQRVAEAGGTPLVVARDNWALGVIHLKDIVKGGMRERFDELRRMGIRTIMITGDNPVTAAVIAEESGVDDFLAEATPEAKMELIREEQAKGPARRDDRRRHERRPRARAVGRRRGDEHRHLGRQGGREHGRPRLEPDEADRDRRGRQAAPHHARVADHLLHRERRGQVLRHHPGDVRHDLRCGGRHVGTAGRPQRHEPGLPPERDRLRDHLQRARHPAPHPPRAPRRPLPGDRRHRPAPPQPPHLRARRRDPPVRGHQAHRPDRAQPVRRLIRSRP